MKLEHPGIYKAVPLTWGLGSQSESSQSTPVVVEFRVVERLEDGVWVDLREFEDQTITGFFYVVGKDGTMNAKIVANLARCLGWTPDIMDSDPPDVIVQITVDQEEYKGVARLKVSWVNRGDHVPGVPKQSADGVKAFKQQFGSQMRAEAASAIKESGGPTLVVRTPVGEVKDPNADLPF
ncbi:MAG: hypothetical protein ABFE13_11430 [Phycisphaerales bacterium]